MVVVWRSRNPKLWLGEIENSAAVPEGSLAVSEC